MGKMHSKALNCVTGRLKHYYRDAFKIIKQAGRKLKYETCKYCNQTRVRTHNQKGNKVQGYIR